METLRAGGSARRQRGDSGATLVEFAIIVPLLFALLFGTVEFGWAFYQDLNTRHGAREGARLAAVNYKSTTAPTATQQRDQIVAETCRRLDPDSFKSVRASLTTIDGVDAGTTATDIGDTVRVVVDADLKTLTGFFNPILAGKKLTSTVEVRLEQAATYANTSGLQACP
jgi:Flp pilus assembly protein TadG